MMMRLASALLISLLAGCGSGPVRFELPPVAERGQVPVAAGTVEMREVTLPLYASQETIYVESPTGELVSDTNILWADDPVRAFTEGLAYALAAQTRARVATEPWPFLERPDVRVEVRFTRALAGRDGQFRVAGQYFIAADEAGRADISRRFALAEPYAPENYNSIAAAKARIIDRLALLIAQNGL